MKSLNLNTVGIGILIVLNIAIAVAVFSGKDRLRRQGHLPKAGFDRKERPMSHAGKKDRFKTANLTEEQKDQIKLLNDTRRKELHKVRSQMKELRKKEHELARDGKLDESQLASLSDEYGQYQKDMYMLNLKNRQAVQSVLTPEQKNALKENRRRGMDRKEHRSAPRKG